MCFFSLDSISLGLFNYEILDFYIYSIVKKNLALKGRSEIPLSGFRQRSPSGEKYLLLQQVFQIKLINIKDYFYSAEVERLVNDESSFINNDSAKEKKLVSELFNFMTGRALKL